MTRCSEKFGEQKQWSGELARRRAFEPRGDPAEHYLAHKVPRRIFAGSPNWGTEDKRKGPLLQEGLSRVYEAEEPRLIAAASPVSCLRQQGGRQSKLLLLFGRFLG